MSVFDPVQAEKDYLRGQFSEAAGLHGEDVEFFPVLSEARDAVGDPTRVLGVPITIPVVLDEYPSIRMLKGLGWFSEEMQSLPIIANIPYWATVPESYDPVPPEPEPEPDPDAEPEPEPEPEPDPEEEPEPEGTKRIQIPVREGAVLRVTMERQDVGRTQDFEIVRVAGSGLRQYYWIVQVAPVRGILTPEEDAGGNYHWVDVPEIED